MKVKYEDRFDSTIEQDRTRVDNGSLTWRDALSMFMYDLPALAERINYETEEVENLF
jgi:hypothetical protein